MKRLIVFFCLVTLGTLLNSCDRDSARETKPGSTSVTGTWELRKGQSGMMPTTDYTSGNGNLWKFSDSTYEQYDNGNLIKNGRYIILPDTSVSLTTGLTIPFGEFTNRIVFDNDFSSPKTFIEVSNDSLTFLSGYFPVDGGSRMLYEKTANNP